MWLISRLAEYLSHSRFHQPDAFSTVCCAYIIDCDSRIARKFNRLLLLHTITAPCIASGEGGEGAGREREREIYRWGHSSDNWCDGQGQRWLITFYYSWAGWGQWDKIRLMLRTSLWVMSPSLRHYPRPSPCPAKTRDVCDCLLQLRSQSGPPVFGYTADYLVGEEGPIEFAKVT